MANFDDQWVQFAEFPLQPPAASRPEYYSRKGKDQPTSMGCQLVDATRLRFAHSTGRGKRKPVSFHERTSDWSNEECRDGTCMLADEDGIWPVLRICARLADDELEEIKIDEYVQDGRCNFCIHCRLYSLCTGSSRTRHS